MPYNISGYNCVRTLRADQSPFLWNKVDLITVGAVCECDGVFHV